MAENLVPLYLCNGENWCDENLKVCPIRIPNKIRYKGISSYRYSDCEKWCDENLEYNYLLYLNCMYVKTEEDGMAFKLRWA